MAKKAPAVADESGKKSGEYLVLARKYRPQNFSQLKGQDALVRTLTNAIESGRIAHAFMLTGVRGVGKTTTARIIARALNCEKGPTVNPCGTCEQCRAISEDRNIDVLEMDAASNNGVDEVRALIDSVQYAPVAGRYKVFILDEVHMLSKPAFNALLKTLEEPPEHVKFIFATTEIRKVPVTILSRCQRFDLRRIDASVLDKYFNELLEKEGVKAEGDAVAMIARAADGSARDGLSLLDQAISREPGTITAEGVGGMLGLVDRSITLDLFEAVMKGSSEPAMKLLDTLYKGGADALAVVQDLLDLTHYLTKTKVAPDVAKDAALPEAERVRGLALAQGLPVPVLTRAWQMLLKGAAEVQHAFNPQLALEMLMIRLLYVAELPTPGDLVKQIKEGGTVTAQGTPTGGPGSGGSRPVMSRTATAAVATQAVEPEMTASVNSFRDVVALFGQHREVVLQSHIMNHVHLVKFESGHISLRLKEGAPANLVGQMSDKLAQWTGQRWIVSLSREQGAVTLAEEKQSAANAVLDGVKADPTVAEALKLFPGAKIIDIRERNT